MSSSWCWSIFRQSSLNILYHLNVNSQMTRRIISGLSFERFSGVMAWNNSRVLYNIYAYTHVYTWVHQINSETSCSSYLIFLLSHKLFSLIYLRIILNTFANLKIASKFFLKMYPKEFTFEKKCDIINTRWILPSRQVVKALDFDSITHTFKSYLGSHCPDGSSPSAD